jgi:hypothetical protein
VVPWIRVSAALRSQRSKCRFGEPDCATAIDQDVRAASPETDEALAQAETILDFSASLPTARHLAIDRAIPGRRASFFLSPSGNDLVALVEDLERRVTLDVLEMQYYRELIPNPVFARHLERPGERYRYGGSCRDVTSRLPQHLVALHAAMASRLIEAIDSDPAPSIRIIRSNPVDFSVSTHLCAPTPAVHAQAGTWRIRTDESFVEMLRGLRNGKLPRETGGVLLGTIDFERRIVYLVDTIASPEDSVEWPTVYIRGCEGLRDRIVGIEEATAGMIGYVGEWHSHPARCSAIPSGEDRVAFGTLSAELAADGLPAIMLIVAEDQIGMYVEQLSDSERPT